VQLGKPADFFIGKETQSVKMETMNVRLEAAKHAAVLMSGASGMLGSAVRKALTAQGMAVRQLVRGPARGEGQIPWNPAAQPAVADPAALEDCTAAIHLSGSSVAGGRWTAAYRRELISSRVDTTHALATALSELQQKPQVLVVASAVGLYGDRGDELLDESSPAGTGFLADLCRTWEAAAQPAADSGIRVVHARFGVVLGRDAGALKKMLPLFRTGLGGNLGDGRQWMSWVSLQDAVAALLFAVATPALTGAINVTAPNPVTNAAFTRALARQLQRPAVLSAPAFALRLVFGQMADEALLASQRAMPSRLICAGFQFTHSTVDEALAAILA
jgi:uncharacterized protein